MTVSREMFLTWDWLLCWYATCMYRKQSLHFESKAQLLAALDNK